MSSAATAFVLKHGPHPDLDPITPGNARRWRAVLAVIADSANKDGEESHPGLNMLIFESCYSRSAVLDATAELEEIGWLVVTQRPSRGNATKFSIPPVKSGVRPQIPQGYPQVQEPDPNEAATGPDSEALGSRNPPLGSRNAEEPPITSSATVEPTVSSAPDEPAQGELVHVPGAPKPAAPRRDEIWDALMEACGIITEQVPKSARGAYNRACKELRDLDAAPSEILRRAGEHRSRWPTVSCTPTSLVRHWAELATSTSAGSGTRGARSRSALSDWAAS